MVDKSLKEKPAAQGIEQLEKRIAKIEEQVKDGKILVFKGVADIEDIVDVVEARLEVRAISRSVEREIL